MNFTRRILLFLLFVPFLVVAQARKNANRLAPLRVSIGESYESPFLNRYDVYQDGTVPMYRDSQGVLWAISGHSHMGHIGVFRGTSLDDMKEAWPMQLRFSTGNAEDAFAGIPYPEGVKARGSVWPFGLYICPNTNRFFCFFHNETGWACPGVSYDAFGLCSTPHFDSDFRHIGLMHSDDEGRTWDFDRWVLTSENVCFTERFNPGAGNMLGQKAGEIDLGSGDFSLFVEPEGDYIYIVYNKVRLSMDEGRFKSVDTYLARTHKRNDGVMGDFVKYYNGSFCEAGNFGKETLITHDSWHSRIAYSEILKCYLMCSAPIGKTPQDPIIADFMEVRTSTNLTDWSVPVSYTKDGRKFGNHYQAIISPHATGNPAVIPGHDFTVMDCHNGTDVLCHDFHFEK